MGGVYLVNKNMVDALPRNYIEIASKYLTIKHLLRWYSISLNIIV